MSDAFAGGLARLRELGGAVIAASSPTTCSPPANRAGNVLNFAPQA